MKKIQVSIQISSIECWYSIQTLTVHTQMIFIIDPVIFATAEIKWTVRILVIPFDIVEISVHSHLFTDRQY